MRVIYRKEESMTTYLVKYVDLNESLCYQDVLAETASDAIQQIYQGEAGVRAILDIYVKV
jgi:hypothetical protein